MKKEIKLNHNENNIIPCSNSFVAVGIILKKSKRQLYSFLPDTLAVSNNERRNRNPHVDDGDSP